MSLHDEIFASFLAAVDDDMNENHAFAAEFLRSSAVRTVMRRKLGKLVKKLPTHEREIIEMRFWNDASINELAKHLCVEVPEARLRLREVLDKLGVQVVSEAIYFGLRRQNL